MAWVILKDGETMTAEELQEYVRSNMAKTQDASIRQICYGIPHECGRKGIKVQNA